MSKSLANLPSDIQTSILGYVLEEVHVFVTENGKADDLKAFLETSGFKNISSKIENDLVTVTAQKEKVFPEKTIVDETTTPDTGCSGNATSSCNSIQSASECGSYYLASRQTTCCSGYCNGSTPAFQCEWNGSSCVNGGGICSNEVACNCNDQGCLS